jgi:uncharacterized protein (TIGR03118 family)
MDQLRSRTVSLLTLLCCSFLFAACGGGDGGHMTPGGGMFQVTNLVSDVAGQAANTDPNLVNAWGLARSANMTAPFWISDNHTGVSTLYDGTGKPFPTASPLVVTVPPPPGAEPGSISSPTGLVFNGTGDFMITEGSNSAPSLFIFDTEDGTLAGWAQTVDVDNAILTVDNSGDEAIYKGLALASNATGNFLFATDFHNGAVDVFDREFQPATLQGSFSDPTIPAGFAPFGIQAIGSNLYVTYAKQDADKEDDVPGAGNGYINVFNTDGIRVKRFASNGTLNSPWGIVLAPANFGAFSNALLVGNFGDGRINAFNPSTGQFLGQLTATNGNPIAIQGLWGLEFGNGGTAGPLDTLFFTAGPGGEEHGLFGSVTAVAG